MDVLSRPLIDRTLPLLAEGYAWLPDRMRDTPGPVVRTRILGRPALALVPRRSIPHAHPPVVEQPAATALDRRANACRWVLNPCCPGMGRGVTHVVVRAGSTVVAR